MRQTATVYNVKPDGTAIVEVKRKSACSGDCDSCKGCHPEQLMRFTAANQAGAVAGDTVTVETGTKKILLSAVLVYILPVFLMIAMYFVPSSGEGRRILSSFAGLCIGIAVCMAYSRFAGRSRAMVASIVGIEKRQ